MINRENLTLVEKRLASNIVFLYWIMKHYGNLSLRRDKTEIENGEPQTLSNIIDDLEDIRKEIE